MPELTEKEIEIIHNTYHIVGQIQTALSGLDGDSGLIAEVHEHNRQIGKIKFRLTLLAGILIGLGILQIVGIF